MSLFGALMGDMEDDQFMSAHVRRMNSMMNSFFRDPIADMMGRAIGSELMPFGQPHRGREMARYDDFGMNFPMMPMGFPNLRSMFQDMGGNPNCHSFSSSTVVTMAPGPDGRPQVYQASQSVKQGPGGIRETKKTVADSRTGVKKMAIGHHINERAHIVEREQNIYSGEQEEREDFINLDEDEAENFNKEWETKTRSASVAAVGYGKHSRHRGSREPQLALPSSAQAHNSARYSGRSSNRPSSSYPALTSSPSSAPAAQPSSRNTGRSSYRPSSYTPTITSPTSAAAAIARSESKDEEPAKKRKLDDSSEDDSSDEDIEPQQKQQKKIPEESYTDSPSSSPSSTA